MGKVDIIKNAFDKLYADLGNDLSPFLVKLVNTGKHYDYQIAGLKIGIWWNYYGRNLLLQIDPQKELGVVTASYTNPKGKNVRLADRFYLTSSGNPVEYKASKFPESSFLLTTEWGGNPDNGPICDLINGFSSGESLYISPDDKETLLKPGKATATSGSSKAPKPGSGAVPGTDTKAEDDNPLPLNLILYGPPGTGKTYHTVNKALEILTGKDWSSAKREDAIDEYNRFKNVEKRIVFTTFHQSMSYEDFIEGIKPDLDGKSIGYKIEDGIFKQIANTAKENSGKPYVLIIDEINRGNVANIFGELITLIEDDKRTTKFDIRSGLSEDNPEGIRVKLPYSKDSEEEFGVPGNLYIIGTMNTADRSVEALDSALRRRFSFEEMMPVPELLESVTIDGTKITLAVLLRTINDRIEILKDREHQIGHSYFMEFVKKDNAGNVVKSTVSPDNLKTVFTDKIIPLLQEYFYGDYEKIQLVVGKGFVKEENNKPHFAVNNIEVDIPEKRFSIIDPDMKDALEKLFNPKDAAE